MKTVTRDSLRFFIVLSVCAMAAVLLWGVCTYDRPSAESRHIDLMKLSRLAAGIHYYHTEHAELLTPSELRTQLLEHKLVENESLFYSAASGIEIRYFTNGNRFVLVSPGKDGKYDTPEGYDALEAVRETGDDILRFGRVGGEEKQRDRVD